MGVPTITVNAGSVIAHGTTADVSAQGLSENPHTPGTGGRVDINLNRSDYATRQTAIDAGGGTATVTAPDILGNIVAAPLLEADGIHERSGSPTIDAGSVDQFSGTQDIDGKNRVVNGAADIGPDEIVPRTEMTLKCAPSPIPLGMDSNCVAIVKDLSAHPAPASGPIKFESDGRGTFLGVFAAANECELRPGRPGQVNLSEAFCEIGFHPEAAGDHRITAEYEGDGSHEGTLKPTLLAVEPAATGGKDATRTTLECSPSTLLVGAISECTATVIDTVNNQSQPEGEVRFEHTGAGEFPGGEEKCASLVAGGSDRATCTFLYKPEAEGEPEITAHYEGDGAHEKSQGSALLTVEPGTGDREKNTTTTAVRCQPSAIVVGSLTTCLVTVTDIPQPNPMRPSGLVSFRHNGTGQGQFTGPDGAVCQLSGGNSREALCAVTYHSEQPGSQTITASYEADSNHEASSVSTTLTVVPKHQTSTSLTCDPAELFLGRGSAICTATVTDVSPSGTPRPRDLTGIVRFTHTGRGSLNTLSCSLNGPEGEASCQVEYTPSVPGAEEGDHVITASFQPGDETHEPSQNTFTIAVKGVPAKTTLSCDHTDLVLESSTICTATVEEEPSSTPQTPHGAVEFQVSGGFGIFSGGSTSCFLNETTGPGEASCKITYTPTTVSTGKHKIKATFQGDGVHLSAPDTFTVNVTPPAGGRPTQTALSCDPPSVSVGVASICTATVHNAAASSPFGTVNLVSDGAGVFSGGSDSCTLQLEAGGQASCKVEYTPSAVGSGQHKITAEYTGERGFATSQGSFTVEVTGTTTTALVCQPDNLVLDGSSSTCTATVTDTRANPSAPLGAVFFEKDSSGTFSEEICGLEPAGPNSSSCHVTYTPSALGPGRTRSPRNTWATAPMIPVKAHSRSR